MDSTTVDISTPGRWVPTSHRKSGNFHQRQCHDKGNFQQGRFALAKALCLWIFTMVQSAGGVTEGQASGAGDASKRTVAVQPAQRKPGTPAQKTSR